MKLPKVENKKLINNKEFIKVAKTVKKSIQEEARYILEKKIRNENNMSSGPYSLS